MRFDYNAFMALFDDDAEGAIVGISASTIALCNCLNASVSSGDFRADGAPLTPEQADEIDAIIALMFDEINPPAPAANFVLFGEGAVTPASYEVGGDNVWLGIILEVTENVVITGVRFYKHVDSGGVHTARIWDTSNTLIADEAFSGESADGWQEVAIDSVEMTTGDTFTIGVNFPEGTWYRTPHDFDDDYDQEPFFLEGGGVNGVYTYPAFDGGNTRPRYVHDNTNYWVSVRVELNA